MQKENSQEEQRLTAEYFCEKFSLDELAQSNTIIAAIQTAMNYAQQLSSTRAEKAVSDVIPP